MILNCDHHISGDSASQAATQNILGCQALIQDMSGSPVSRSNICSELDFSLLCAMNMQVGRWWKV